MDCYKVHQIGKKGLVLIGGLNIDETALLVEKTELSIKGDNFSWESVELDIPKQYLTLEIIENIQRLNS